jgi:tetratricopeptide (TPR) repeat protein
MSLRQQRKPVIIPATGGECTAPGIDQEATEGDGGTDSDDAKSDDVDGQGVLVTPPEILLEQNWKRYRLRAKKKQGHLAVRSLVRCLALSHIVHGTPTWRTAQVHSELAKAYLELRDMPAQAVKHSQAARDMAVPLIQRLRDNVGDAENSSDDLLCAQKDELVEVLSVVSLAQLVLGRAFCSLNKYSEGEVTLVKAKQYAEELQKSSTHPNLTQTLETNKALGLCCLKQKKTRAAHDYLDKAKQLATKLYGEESDQLIDIHQNIGKVYYQESNLDAAIEEYLKAHSIAVARYGQDSEFAAETVYCLAMAYLAMGGSDAETVAEGYLNDCLLTFQCLHGPQSTKTIKLQEELCRLMLRTDRYKEAVEQLSQVVVVKRMVYGDPSEELAATYKLLGTVHLSQGHLDKAVQQFQKSHGILKTVLGPHHKQTITIQQTIEMLSRYDFE